MIFGLRRVQAFSLVELTLALGVAAFCLIAVFGLIPVGVQTNRNATSQTTATNIIAAIIADLRAGATSGFAPVYCITFGNTKTIYCDDHDACSFDAAGLILPCNNGATFPNIKTRYRATITFPSPPPSISNVTYANVKVTWPAEADLSTTTPEGSVQMFAAINRN